LEDHGIEAGELVPASRKLGEAEARQLIRDAAKVWIAKGKKFEAFEGGSADDEIVGRMLGSTGNLRAPTIRAGNRLLVGFNEDTYRDVLG